MSMWGMWGDTSIRKRKRERKQNIRGKMNGANMNSLLKLLWFLLRLFLVGDNKVDGILWLLKQSSQFSLDLLSPEDSTNTNPYRCPLALLTYTNTRFMLCMNWISIPLVEDIYKMYNIPVNRLYGKPSVIYFLLSKCIYLFFREL